MWRFGRMGPPGWEAHPWWWLVLGRVVPFLILAALVGLVVWAILRFSRDRALAAGAAGRGGLVGIPASGPMLRPDAAMDQVRMRYAKGEIAREDFLRLAQDLGGPSAEAGGGGPQPGEAGTPTQG